MGLVKRLDYFYFHVSPPSGRVSENSQTIVRVSMKKTLPRYETRTEIRKLEHQHIAGIMELHSRENWTTKRPNVRWLRNVGPYLTRLIALLQWEQDNSPTRRFVAGVSPHGVSPTRRFADSALRRRGVSPSRRFAAWRFADAAFRRRGASPHGVSPTRRFAVSPTRRFADRRNADLASSDKRKMEDSGRAAISIKASIKQ